MELHLGGIFRVHMLGAAVGYKRKFKDGYELIWIIGEPGVGEVGKSLEN